MEFIKKVRWNPDIYNPGFTYSYICKSGDVGIIANALAQDTIFDNIAYLFNNPSDAFVSLFAYPFDVYKFNFNDEVVATTPVYLGDTLLQKDGQDMYLSCVDSRVFQRLVGTINIERYFNNFLDFNPYTKIEIYLPFADIVTLDANVWMGYEMKIYLSVDFGIGACTYYLYRIKNNKEELMGEVNGQVGIEIPLGATNKNEQSKQMMSLGLSTAVGVVTSIIAENPVPLLMTLGASATNKAFDNLQLRIQKGGRIGGAQVLMNPYTPYLIITRPTAIPIDYAHEKGLPLMETRNLSTLKGFTKVEDVHLDGFTIATSSELDEIENLLNVGVIL